MLTWNCWNILIWNRFDPDLISSNEWAHLAVMCFADRLITKVTHVHTSHTGHIVAYARELNSVRIHSIHARCARVISRARSVPHCTFFLRSPTCTSQVYWHWHRSPFPLSTATLTLCCSWTSRFGLFQNACAWWSEDRSSGWRRSGKWPVGRPASTGWEKTHTRKASRQCRGSS